MSDESDLLNLLELNEQKDNYDIIIEKNKNNSNDSEKERIQKMIYFNNEMINFDFLFQKIGKNN